MVMKNMFADSSLQDREIITKCAINTPVIHPQNIQLPKLFAYSTCLLLPCHELLCILSTISIPVSCGW